MCGDSCGLVLGIAAAFIVPGAGVALADAMVVSETVGTAIAGAIAGGFVAGVTGNNILGGMALGGIGGGLTGASNTMGGLNGISDSVSNGTFMSDLGSAVTTPITGSGSAGLSAGANIAGGVEDATGFGNAMGPAANVGGTSGPLLGNIGDQSLVTNNMSSGLGGMQSAGLTSQPGGFTNVNPGSVDLAGSSAVLPSSGGNWLSNGLGNAGLSTDGLVKALPQLAGVFGNKGPSTEDMKTLLDAQQAKNDQAFNYNVNSANKKAAIGDSLATDAGSMDPSYYGRQAQFGAQGQADSQLQDSEAKLRAQGYDEAAIQAFRQKQQVQTAQVTGTAYDKGSQAGLNARNATYGAAGNMYGTVAAPTDMSQSYMALAEKGQKDAGAAGKAVESLFGGVKKNSPTGAASTV